MDHPVGTFLFAAAIVGNGVVLVAGLMFAVGSIVRRAAMGFGSGPSPSALTHESRAFHHVDHIQTPLGEWVFMAVACLAVLVGLPVILAVLFQYGLPALGLLWNHG